MIKIQALKYILLFLIFISSSLIGKFLAQKYTYRFKELEELKSVLNIIKSKIKFTYEPIPEIFSEIIDNKSQYNNNIINIFKLAKEKLQYHTAENAWNEAVDETINNLNKEDRQALKNLSKSLGQTDIEGQISQIDITQNFIDIQLKNALEEKQKNGKLYYKLGTIIGIAITIILI